MMLMMMIDNYNFRIFILLVPYQFFLINIATNQIYNGKRTDTEPILMRQGTCRNQADKEVIFRISLIVLK